MFYDRYMKICEMRGVSPTRVLVDLGLSKSAITNWKSGGEPYNETKKKIADYFGITIAELMSDETKSAPATKAETDNEMLDMLEDIRRNPDLKILFSLSKKATPEDLRKAIKIIKTISGDDDERGNF